MIYYSGPINLITSEPTLLLERPRRPSHKLTLHKPDPQRKGTVPDWIMWHVERVLSLCRLASLLTRPRLHANELLSLFDCVFSVSLTSPNRPGRGVRKATARGRTWFRTYRKIRFFFAFFTWKFQIILFIHWWPLYTNFSPIGIIIMNTILLEIFQFKYKWNWNTST